MHKPVELIITIIVLLLELTPLTAQQDRPRIKNFTKQQYNAENQNWGIGQDEEGMLYFANNQGLLSFDGVSWTLSPLPNNTIVRSIEVISSGKIFTGSYEEFGFWERDAQGLLQYTSLKPLLGDYQFHNEEIWKIITWKGITYFQSFSVIFAYDGTRVITLRPPGLITCFTEVHGKLYLVVVDHGLHELLGNNIYNIDSSAFFRQTMIRVLLPYEHHGMLVASANKGFYLRDTTGSVKSWNIRPEDFDVSSSINRGLVTDNGLFVIGTILKGMYAFDREAKLVMHINKENGIQNNTVLALYEDVDGYLWAGLDNGIDMVDPGSSIRFYYDLSGRLGSVYTAVLHEGRLYAGTNQGLFFSSFNKGEISGKLDFNFIPGTTGQVWSLASFGKQLLCGHNDRTYEIRNDGIVPVSPVSGGFAFCKIRKGSYEYLLQSTYTDLALFTGGEGNWTFARTLEHFRNPTRHIETDHLGNIWASHLQRGIYRLTTDDELTKITSSEFYGRQKGFASDFHINVFKVHNRVVFTNEGKVYSYNDLFDSIVPFEFIESQLRQNSRIQSILPAGGDDYWFVTDNSIDLYGFETGKIKLKRSYPFEVFDNKLIRHYENICPVDSVSWMVCLENGIAIINHGPARNTILQKRAKISQVATTGHHEGFLPVKILTAERPHVLSYSQNGLQFNFSCPLYDSKLNFLVMLDGIEDNWIQTDLPYYRYDRLPWGSYTFHVKAVDALGNVSSSASWSFTIKPPWFWSIASRMVYVILLLLGFAFLRMSVKRRLQKQAMKLSQEKERELVELNNEKLQNEVHYKSMQLANTTFAMVKKNELLIEIKRLLSTNKHISDPKVVGQFRDIRKLLDDKISNDDDWQVFESNFEQAHEAFLKRIKKQYPSLTPSDLKLCAFIRMNLSSKKIAPLLGISIRGVENHRYRLRTKMELDRDINLTDYLMNF